MPSTQSSSRRRCGTLPAALRCPPPCGVHCLRRCRSALCVWLERQSTPDPMASLAYRVHPVPAVRRRHLFAPARPPGPSQRVCHVRCGNVQCALSDRQTSTTALITLGCGSDGRRAAIDALQGAACSEWRRPMHVNVFGRLSAWLRSPVSSSASATR